MRDAEFTDNDTDRAALAAILTAAGEKCSPHDDLAHMNGVWDRLGPGLVSAPDRDFDGWTKRLDKLLVSQSDAVRVRVNDVIAHLIGWRLGDV